MSKDRLDINALQEIAQKSLEVVQQILGVESNNICAQNELEPYVDTHSIHSNKNITASELTEQKHYLTEQKRYLTKKYAENKLVFEKSREKFLNRPKRRKRLKSFEF